MAHLHKRERLARVYTQVGCAHLLLDECYPSSVFLPSQNIDGLEDKAGLPSRDYKFQQGTTYDNV
jgi:NAD-dependent SIR2 family protein deacetylase